MALAPPCIFGRRHARPRPPLGQRGDQRAATRICFEWRVKQVRPSFPRNDSIGHSKWNCALCAVRKKKKNSMSGSFTCAAGVEDVNEKRSTVRGCVLGRFCRLSGQTERSICHLCASQVREAAPSNGARRCVVLMPNGSFNSISTFFN